MIRRIAYHHYLIEQIRDTGLTSSQVRYRKPWNSPINRWKWEKEKSFTSLINFTIWPGYNTPDQFRKTERWDNTSPSSLTYWNKTEYKKQSEKRFPVFHIRNGNSPLIRPDRKNQQSLRTLRLHQEVKKSHLYGESSWAKVAVRVLTRTTDQAKTSFQTLWQTIRSMVNTDHVTTGETSTEDIQWRVVEESDWYCHYLRGIYSPRTYMRFLKWVCVRTSG